MVIFSASLPGAGAGATGAGSGVGLACAQALAELAREDVPDEVDAAYAGEHLVYGPEYIIPVPFDPRLMSSIPPRIAQAAMDSGVARQPIEDMDEYRRSLAMRFDPTSSVVEGTFEAVPPSRIRPSSRCSGPIMAWPSLEPSSRAKWKTRRARS